MVTLDGKTYDITIRYTGSVGELDYDSSNMDLILHDGAAEGGIRFLNADNAGELFQPRSEELDGLNGFEPQQRGFLARRGPGDYRIRQLKVNEQNLEITEPLGYEGDPLFGLAPTIASDHSWTGVQTFESKIEATGGVEGDVTGNVTGDLTGDTAGIHTGSVDTTGATLTLDADQVERAWLAEDVRLSLVPSGCIIMWSGAEAQIPNGWLLCDGSSGTPDLRNRFVAGAGDLLNPGNTGGDDATQLTITIENGWAHTHEGEIGAHVLTIAELPSHSHGAGVCDGGNYSFNRGTKAANPAAPKGITQSHEGTNEAITEAIGGGEGHTHTMTLENGGAHTHTGHIDPFDITPPYYALCYIMRAF